LIASEGPASSNELDESNWAISVAAPVRHDSGETSEFLWKASQRMAILPTDLGFPGRQAERKNPSRALESGTRCGYSANEQFSKRYDDSIFMK
jgi:hypothetical protein